MLTPRYHIFRMFVVDSHKGGLGITLKLFEFIPDLIACAVVAIESCECEQGCSSCVWSSRCSEYNVVSDKKTSLLILKSLLGQQTPQ